MKVCTKCGDEKPLEEFAVAKSNKDGRNNRCKACIRAYSKQHYKKNLSKYKERNKTYYQENKEYCAEKSREWRKKNQDLVNKRARVKGQDPAVKKKRAESTKKWRDQNPEYNKIWYEENKQRKQAKAKEWEKNNKHIRKEIKIRRKLKRKQATPAWANKEKMKAIYQSCPEGYEVDHIIPLSGENVSGLHVETNLQYLPAEENRRKSNKFDGTI